MTERLYYADSFLLDFDARVVGHTELNDQPAVALDRSAFYPESGGQLGDLGTLGEARVADVQVDDAGVVHHLMPEGRPEIGATVQGRIDRPRRRLHMALHTGQHVLSQALVQECSAPTRSSRLGDKACTLDVEAATLTEADVARAEALANAVVEDDLRIQSRFLEAGELEGLNLRRTPKVTENIRVVEVGDFDLTPCGGTHCTNSAQIGLLRVRKLERYKKLWRITFSAGRRALAEYQAQTLILDGLAREFTCGTDRVTEAIEKLRRESLAARDELGQFKTARAEALVGTLADAAKAAGLAVVVARLDELSPDLLRKVAGRLSEEQGLDCFLCTRHGDNLQAIIQRAGGSELNCGAFFKELAAQTGGRGGGRAERAEGRVPADTDWDVAVAALR